MTTENKQDDKLAHKPRKEVAVMMDELVKRKDSIQKMSAKWIDLERLFLITQANMSRNPKLFECTTNSLVRAVITCAEMGLEPTGRWGGAYLIPRWNGKLRVNECTVIADYRAMMDLAKRCGEVRDMDVQPVYANDVCEITQGESPKVIHRLHLGKDRGAFIGAYSVIFLPDTDRVKLWWMSSDEITAIKNRTKSRDREGNVVGPWISDPIPMSLKTVVRSHINKLSIRATPLRKAMEADAEEAGETESASTTSVTIDMPESTDGDDKTTNMEPTNADGQSTTDAASAAKALSEVDTKVKTARELLLKCISLATKDEVWTVFGDHSQSELDAIIAKMEEPAMLETITSLNTKRMERLNPKKK